MLLFRDEEHVSRWRRQWQMSAGAMLPLDVAWRLAQGWFDADRSAPEWRRPAVDRVEQLFTSLSLTGEYWQLR